MGRNGPKIGLNASPLLGMVLAQKPQDGSKRLGASFFVQNQSVSIIVSPFSRNAKAPFEALYFLLTIRDAYRDYCDKSSYRNRRVLSVLKVLTRRRHTSVAHQTNRLSISHTNLLNRFQWSGLCRCSRTYRGRLFRAVRPGAEQAHA